MNNRTHPVCRVVQQRIALGQCRQHRLQLDAGDVAAGHACREAETHGADARTKIEHALARLLTSAAAANRTASTAIRYPRRGCKSFTLPPITVFSVGADPVLLISHDFDLQ